MYGHLCTVLLSQLFCVYAFTGPDGLKVVVRFIANLHFCSLGAKMMIYHSSVELYITLRSHVENTT